MVLYTMSEFVVPALTIVGAVIAAVAVYIRSEKWRAVYGTVIAFSELAAAHYRMEIGGWTATEKDALADLTIAFFDAVERAGVSITRPGGGGKP